MEQSQKNNEPRPVERPRWLDLVEGLPEATRQTVGNLCASTIQNLAVLALISGDLYDAVCAASVIAVEL